MPVVASQKMYKKLSTGIGSGGYAGDLTPQLFMWGYWYVYPLEKNIIPTHANCGTRTEMLGKAI